MQKKHHNLIIGLSVLSGISAVAVIVPPIAIAANYNSKIAAYEASSNKIEDKLISTLEEK